MFFCFQIKKVVFALLFKIIERGGLDIMGNINSTFSNNNSDSGYFDQFSGVKDHELSSLNVRRQLFKNKSNSESDSKNINFNNHIGDDDDGDDGEIQISVCLILLLFIIAHDLL